MIKDTKDLKFFLLYIFLWKISLNYPSIYDMIPYSPIGLVSKPTRQSKKDTKESKTGATC